MGLILSWGSVQVVQSTVNWTLQIDFGPSDCADYLINLIRLPSDYLGF